MQSTIVSLQRAVTLAVSSDDSGEEEENALKRMLQRFSFRRGRHQKDLEDDVAVKRAERIDISTIYTPTETMDEQRNQAWNPLANSSPPNHYGTRATDADQTKSSPIPSSVRLSLDNESAGISEGTIESGSV